MTQVLEDFNENDASIFYSLDEVFQENFLVAGQRQRQGQKSWGKDDANLDKAKNALNPLYNLREVCVVDSDLILGLFLVFYFLIYLVL